MRLLSFLKKATVIAFIVGGIIGLVAALAAEQIDHVTNTDAFCTSCHLTKVYIADAEVYKTSAHQATASGVRPKCSDCHIPKGLVRATYTHIVKGVQDLWGEISYDYDDPKVWEAEKARLADAVRHWMLANDSATCRSCHEQASIKPERKRGQRQHAEAIKKGTTCIACHYNLVHEEIEPSETFLKAVDSQ